ncbi:phage head closure protein [Ochrobactrum sp. Marseille-Q0166]|uniref:phage head closure protein n=1 Tax=Ochrobactrum sp. Marseille-Q0166 TaxID=2761105 RepID=UPI0016551A04|nr:phage head closure protein [Ochrobactrum sp. Marseille-Q0166]MBC8718165.1 phage head closure protein [Ochrobactrum sp. Marseille-Q0166]
MSKTPRTPNAAMNERVVFQQRENVRDEGGGVRGEWVDKFEERARLRPRLGSETVIAAGLEGVQPYTLTVHSNSRTRLVTPAWRISNARNDRTYNIKSIMNPDESNAYIEAMVTDEGGG